MDCLIYAADDRNKEIYVVNASGKEIKLVDVQWDFYPLYGKQCGWGYLNNHEHAIMPKMWRKDDFKLLLEHIDKNPQFFSGFRIRKAE